VIDRRPVQLDWQSPVPERPAWQVAAACRGLDPDLFYPDRGGSTEAAKAVCVSCPVSTQCLDFALSNSERFGIWGGKSERERRRLRRFPRRQSPTATCPCCGDTFRPSGRTHRFCSADCRIYHQRQGAA
jgi:WhiB family transcriptional regulator, redox-sensing transcriptional regulator